MWINANSAKRGNKFWQLITLQQFPADCSLQYGFFFLSSWQLLSHWNLDQAGKESYCVTSVTIAPLLHVVISFHNKIQKTSNTAAYNRCSSRNVGESRKRKRHWLCTWTDLLQHQDAGHTYLLTPWSKVLLEKLVSLQLVKKFPAFHGTRRFLTALTSARHLSLSWASPIQSSHPNPTSWRSILILSSHLRLGLPSGLFLYTPLPPYGPHAPPISFF